ncbi:Threonine synthase [Pseudomonas sp. R2-7-07]|nr:Threonine synthase [Pseudomonas sp. R2-7-07]
MWEKACSGDGSAAEASLTDAPRSKCGRGLAPDGGGSVANAHTDPPLSEHRYLHNLVAAAYANHDAKRAALDLALDLGAPLNHAGRNSTVIWGVNRQGCRFSRPAPWMARGGGPPNQCRITGTPSLGEVPSGGARAFCLLLRFSKVRRRKGGTHSSRYRSNGYVLALIQHHGRLSGRHRGQAPSHILDAGHQLERLRLPSRHWFRAIPKLCRYPWLSGASPLPHLDRRTAQILMKPCAIAGP